MSVLTNIFMALLTITGILLLCAIIVSIISLPFENAKKRKKIEELQDVFKEAINEIVDEAVEELKKEESKDNETKKKDEE